MLSLRAHIEAESERWAASRRAVCYDERSVTSSSGASSTADSVFSSSQLRNKNGTRMLSRRASISTMATELDPEPAEQQQPPTFVAPRDFDGSPIPVYASLEAAVAQRVSPFVNQGQAQDQDQGQGEGGVMALGGEGEGFRGEQPRRLVTPGKLYENEEDDDEIIYE